MTIENWVSVGTMVVNLITIICYTITLLVKSKKNGAQVLANIVKTIPSYITQAKATLTNATNKTVCNFVLAEIKEDFEEVLNKKMEKTLQKAVKTEVENYAQ